MEYRNIPALNKQVSVIGLGCEGFLETTDEQFDEMFDHACELGINFWDLYSPDPQFRQRLGKRIRGHRKDFVLQSHLCSVWKNESYVRTRKIDEVKEGFEQMLRLLDTDYIDIGMIHYVDEQKDFDFVFHGPIYEYATKLKEEGKIKAIGMSSHNPLVAIQAVEQGLIDVLLFSVNPAYDLTAPSEDVNILFDKETWNHDQLTADPARLALYDLCAQKGVAIDVMKAFGGGDMLDEKLSPFGCAFTPVQCLDYCLNIPAVVSVMASVHNPEQMDELLHYFEASEEEKDYTVPLSRVSLDSLQGHCLYCTHCEPCVQSIKIPDVNKLLALAKAEGQVWETVQDHYDCLIHKAGECIGCHVCETRCPFGVDIVSSMKEAAALFEQ